MTFDISFRSLRKSSSVNYFRYSQLHGVTCLLHSDGGYRYVAGDVHGSLPVLFKACQASNRIRVSPEGYLKFQTNHEEFFNLLPKLPWQITKLAEGNMTPEEYSKLVGFDATVDAEELKTKGRSLTQNLSKWMNPEGLQKKLFGSLDLVSIWVNIQEYLNLIAEEIQAPLERSQHPALAWGPLDEPLFLLGDQFNDRNPDLKSIP
jgi:hypothetical protein